uniref:helix-hairpin-helix domain-containing protein n=1 Tax=Gemmatimonas sp. TaxID=1962908 RepID=UPI0037C0C7F5
MNCRDASHALSQVSVLLELHDGDRAMVKAMQTASRVVSALGDQPLANVLADTLASADALPAAALDVLRELADSNSSSLLERLQEETPEGLMEMLRVPGLGPARIRSLHEHLHIESLLELELAANDGRLADVPKFGEKTAEKVRKALVDLRATGAYVLWQ